MSDTPTLQEMREFVDQFRSGGQAYHNQCERFLDHAVQQLEGFHDTLKTYTEKVIALIKEKGELNRRIGAQNIEIEELKKNARKPAKPSLIKRRS